MVSRKQFDPEVIFKQLLYNIHTGGRAAETECRPPQTP